MRLTAIIWLIFNMFLRAEETHPNERLFMSIASSLKGEHIQVELTRNESSRLRLLLPSIKKELDLQTEELAGADIPKNVNVDFATVKTIGEFYYIEGRKVIMCFIDQKLNPATLLLRKCNNKKLNDDFSDLVKIILERSGIHPLSDEGK